MVSLRNLVKTNICVLSREIKRDVRSQEVKIKFETISKVVDNGILCFFVVTTELFGHSAVEMSFAVPLIIKRHFAPKY